MTEEINQSPFFFEISLGNMKLGCPLLPKISLQRYKHTEKPPPNASFFYTLEFSFHWLFLKIYFCKYRSCYEITK